jgi:hypothetical protein
MSWRESAELYDDLAKKCIGRNTGSWSRRSHSVYMQHLASTAESGSYNPSHGGSKQRGGNTQQTVVLVPPDNRVTAVVPENSSACRYAHRSGSRSAGLRHTPYFCAKDEGAEYTYSTSETRRRIMSNID